MLIASYQHIVDLSLKSAFFHPPMMIRRCGARSVASLGTEMPSPGLRLTHCPAFKEALQLQLPTGQDLYSKGFLPQDFNLLQTCRAPVLAIDPPPHAPALPFKMALVGSRDPKLTQLFFHSLYLLISNSKKVGHLPLSHPKDGGQLYLANMGIPKNVYKEVIVDTWHLIRSYSSKDYIRLVSSLLLPLVPSL